MSGAAAVGGADVGAIVIDAGSYHVRLGVAGDDAPRLVYRSCVGERVIEEQRMEGAETAEAAADESKSEAVHHRVQKYYGDDLFTRSKFLDRIMDIDIGDPSEYVKSMDDSHGSELCQLLSSACSLREMSVDVKAKPLLIVEPSIRWTSKKRHEICQRLFEEVQTPAVFLLRSAVGAAFSSARSTALVVDLGHQAAVVTPVSDGYAMYKIGAKANIELGGAAFTEKIAQSVYKQLQKATPSGDGNPSAATGPSDADEDVRIVKKVKREAAVAATAVWAPALPGGGSSSSAAAATAAVVESVPSPVTRDPLYFDQLVGRLVPMEAFKLDCKILDAKDPSWRSFYQRRLLDDVKYSVLRVGAGLAVPTEGEDKSKGIGASPGDVNGVSNISAPVKLDDGVVKTRYELPDGQVLTFAEDEINSLGEHFFAKTPSFSFLANTESLSPIPGAVVGAAASGLSFSQCSLSELCLSSIMDCDTDLRRELTNAVVLCGGGVQIPGLYARLQKELAIMTPQQYKIRIMAPQFGVSGLERSSAAWIGGSILGSLGTFQQMWFSKADYDELGPTSIDRRCP